MLKRVLCCGLLLTLTGCMTVGPDYQRPAVDTPAAWRFEEKEVRELANTAWWEQFNDPVLNGLVDTALEENKDLLIATARIEEFFGRYFSARGDQFPVGRRRRPTPSRQRVSEKGLGDAHPAGRDNALQPVRGVPQRRSWEIDFWGKFRRATEAARAELLSTEEARRTVVLTLVSAVAAAYVDIAALDKQLEITQRTVETRKGTLELFQLRFDKGIISEVDLSQAESEYEDALARIPDIERAIGRTENALSVLLGRNPRLHSPRPDPSTS
ncbi:MAG: TolC family protein [Deltaproteobacteria bacterium]|nr:TolC family protein [Deltaproteobacteria bacterium]